MKIDFEKMADARIEAAMNLYKQEDNHMGLYSALIGTNFWKLETHPESGHNYYYIIEAIYRYHKLHPEDKIDEYYLETLMKMAKSVTNEIQVVNLFNIISAQLENEKNQVSTFKVNIIEVLKTFKKHFEEYEKLQKDRDANNKIKEYDEYIDKHYGHKVL